MRRTAVDDLWGGRWIVRVRRDRYLVPETEHALRVKAPTLQTHLAAALDPRHRASAVSLPDDMGWIRRDHIEALNVSAVVVVGGRPIDLVRAIWRIACLLNEPTDRSWVVELIARGRIRRGATWRVADSQLAFLRARFFGAAAAVTASGSRILAR